MIRKVSIKDQVYDELKKRIVGNYYKSGDEIVIARITNELGVSNTPVREALSQLNSEGIVETTMNSKYKVTNITDEIMHEMNQAAVIFMLGGYDMCLQLGCTDELKKNLRKAYESQIKIANTKDIHKYVTTAMSFDEAFISTTKNKYLVSAMNQLTTLLALTASAVDILSRPDNISQHKAILEAVEADDVTLAKELIKHHFDKHIE